MYLPFAFLALSVLMGGDLIGDLIGLAAGHCYYYLKDVVPINFRKEVLITPRFLRRIDHWGQSINESTATSSNYYYSGGNNNNNTNNNNNNNDQGGRGSFQAFSGRGTTWG